MAQNVNITIEGRFEKKLKDIESLMKGAGFSGSGNSFSRGTVTVSTTNSTINVRLDSGQMSIFRGTLDKLMNAVKAETTRVTGLK